MHWKHNMLQIWIQLPTDETNKKDVSIDSRTTTKRFDERENKVNIINIEKQTSNLQYDVM